MSVQMFECRVSRRGKAAKGTISIKTFGKPVAVKGDKGITKKWDYSHAPTVDKAELEESVKEIAHINTIIMVGADYLNKSQGARAQSEVAILTMIVFNLGIADDVEEAKNVATSFRNAKLATRKAGYEITIQQLIDQRVIFITKEIADGNRKSNPRFEKMLEEKTLTEEIEISEEDESSDEIAVPA